MWKNHDTKTLHSRAQEQPFLRTQMNSPAETEEKVSMIADPVSLSAQRQD